MNGIVKRQFRKAGINPKIRACALGGLTLLFTGLFAVAQETAPNTPTVSALAAAAASSSPVPRLVRFAGVARDTENRPLTGITGITFLLYKDQEGGAPLWMETQNVQPEASGRYSVQLGATKPDGLPTDVFTSGEARWLAVQISGQSEQARVLLLSVPYALKAADAETFGGLPPSAFVKVASNTSAGANFRDSRRGNTTSAAAEGAPNQQGKLGPQTKGLDYVAKFITAGGALGNSLIFDNGTNVGVGKNTPAFPLDVNGIVNAASYNLAGQAFAFGSSANSNAYLGFSGNSAITGQNNTGTGVGALFSTNTGAQNTANGAYALYFNTTGTANTATGWLALNKNNGIQNTATGVQAMENNVSGNNNTADGVFSLFENTTGTANTAVGSSTLSQNIGGSYNTATGNTALELNTTGSFNTAVGNLALYNNVAGSSNTALGVGAGPDSKSTNLSNSTAIGANAVVSENNALILGGTGVNAVDVGIGTATPRSILEADVAGAGGKLGPAITLTNTAGGTLSGASVDFNTYTPFTTGTYNPSSRIEAVDQGNYSDSILFETNTPGVANNKLQTDMIITSTGKVGIGTTPTAVPQLEVVAQAGVSNVAIVAQGYGQDGGDGIDATGATGQNGGNGISGYGGVGEGGEIYVGGDGGSFVGGNSNENAGYGVFAEGGTGPNTLAAYFDGNVNVTGAITAGTKDFKIDHPLDPANKYLYHASVESSEMMNIYTGNVTTDSQGNAAVQLPAWFEVLNTDFRYQLTAIGQFARAIVSNEVANHQFSIKTDKPNVKISWQITGVRQDAYAKAHPLVVEQEKDARERGHYIHPELFGASEQQSIEWARNPQMMSKIQEMKARQAAEAEKKTPQPK